MSIFIVTPFHFLTCHKDGRKCVKQLRDTK